MVKTPFVFIVKYEGAGVKIAEAAEKVLPFARTLRYNKTW